MKDDLDTKPSVETIETKNEVVETPQADEPSPRQKFARLHRFAHAYWRRKKWTLPLTVFVLLVLLLGIPFTRYMLLGTVVRNQVTVSVYDIKTNKPVSGADVIIGGASGKTDLGGNVLLHPKLGGHTLLISKKYYTSVSQSVTVGWPGKVSSRQALSPTGRLVPVELTNIVTGKAIAGASIKAAGTVANTDKAGKATIVLPATSTSQKAVISLNGYNSHEVTLTVTDQMVAENKFTLTPSGKLYFLSNQSGKIDVVKTNLDGTARQTVFAGTGTEDAQSTSLLASRDWKYLALLAKHGANSQSLYLINTANDQATNIDGGNAAVTFTLVGWSNTNFVYQVNRSNVSNWQPGGQALKSYDASSGKLYNIDQTQGEGTGNSDYSLTTFSTAYLLGNNEVVYVKNWQGCCSQGRLAGKNASLVSVKTDGTNKRTVKDFPLSDTQYSSYITLTAYEPQSVYVQAPNNDGTNAYYEYEDGKLAAKNDVNDESFGRAYPTFLAAPSGKQTFWSEVRDNKNTLFIGDSTGKNQKQIASLSDFTPYGWYTDKYLLVSKNGSELYITTPENGGKSRKITDYYKPQATYRGYGGGYGGL